MVNRFFLFLLLFFIIPNNKLLSAVSIGSFGKWEAFTEKENGQLVCFIGSSPIKMQGKYKIRGKTYILITHRPHVGENNVVMVAAGYNFKKDSKAKIIISGVTTELFTEYKNAFAIDEKTDKKLIQLMIKGSSMTFKGTSSRGTLTNDTYSLRGFTAAYRLINKKCKL